MPALDSDRMAVSRPDPGPRTSTSTRRTPCSMARRAHCSAAIWAANGVDLRDPLKPTLPAEAQAMTLPSWSEIDTIVLLKELLMWATPAARFGGLGHRYLRTFFFPATVFFGPLRVRALVWVR